MKDRLRTALKGSFTVEMTLILPVSLGVILAVLYLGFYRYDQAVCKAACYEMAFLMVKEGAVTARCRETERWLKDSTIAMDHIKVQTRLTENSAEAWAEGSMTLPFFPVTFTVSVGQQMEIAHPAETVRTIRQGLTLLE